MTMNAASQIFLILGILSFLLMKTLGKNPYKSMKPRYCSRVNHTPDQHLQVLTPSLGDRDTSLQAGRSAANKGRESMLKRADDNESLDCNNRHSLVQGIVRESGKYVLVVLHACPIVKKMVLQLRSAGFVRQYPRRRFFSCLRVHDTVVLFRPTGRQIVSVEPPVAWKGLKDSFSVAWNYEIATDQNTTEWFFGQEKIDVDETVVPKRQPKVRYSECGSHWSCVRIGEPGCGHMSCDYLLTYTFENRSKLILEMSGKSDGWVALGLSSDNKMGGDEVVACKRKSSKGRQLEAFSGWISQPHSRPEKKTDGNFELIKQEHKDGYIFCKMIRTVKINEVGGDTSLDLTAKWYQMYTRGQVDNRGAMLQYNEILTSKDPVSMLEPFQIDSTDFGQLEFSQQTKKSQRDADPRLAGSRLQCSYSYITSLAFFIIMLLA